MLALKLRIKRCAFSALFVTGLFLSPSLGVASFEETPAQNVVDEQTLMEAGCHCDTKEQKLPQIFSDPDQLSHLIDLSKIADQMPIADGKAR